MSARRVVLKNSWSNHTGLAAANLLLNNVWRMYRYEVRTTGRPSRGWWHGTDLLIKAAVTGWFHRHGLRTCRLRKVSG